ncbi:MAG: gamma-glutamyltransferase [Candidatus Binatia bacterium]|nr:gamma-glutamyltransferase [Candidatus Binatia bacterium]
MHFLVAVLIATTLFEQTAWATPGGVVAAENAIAAEVGIAVLDEGGSAVDAAIAASLAACVVHSTSCGIGGGGFMVVYDATTKKSVALDYREVAPAAVSESLYLENGKYVRERSRLGPHAIGVPGEIAGLAAAHARFGRLPWSRLVAPAARLAREGFPVTAHMGRKLASSRDGLAKDPELAALFLNPDGSAPKEGETLRLTALADTLDAVAKDGPEAFYSGKVAHSIAKSVRDAGGVMTEKDLADYEPVWREPLETTYRGSTIYTMPPPSAGGTAVVLALDTLSGMDVKSLGATSPERYHLFAEILQHAFADRAVSSGDPAFDPPPPAADGAALRTRIDTAKTHPAEYYGTTRTAGRAGAPPDDAGTGHISVIAPDGSAAAATTTINTAFGALLGARGSGVTLNNELDDFSFPAPNYWGVAPGKTNHIAPRKRPTSSMTPTIAVQDGKAVVAVGASGGPLIISATLEVLTNVLDFGLPPEAAVAAPRIHHQWQPQMLLIEPGIGPADRKTLETLGHEIREIPGVAAVSLATAFPANGPAGAGDPRKGGAARTGNRGDRDLDGCEDVGKDEPCPAVAGKLSP